MKISIKNIIVLLSCVLIFSCDDYLEVQPKTKLLEAKAFSDQNTIQAILNGSYTNMTKSSLYGGFLTMSALEVMAQRFYLRSSADKWYLFGKYDYKVTQYSFNGVWIDMYKNILNINSFISGLDKTDKGVISEKNRNILKGEALGLRAMFHFDLLRLFGPVYSKNPGELSIRYQTKPSAEATKKLPANEVIKLILDDLSKAEELLEKDPIRTYGKIAVEEESPVKLKKTDPAFGYKGSNFYRFRNFRMNYYAVKALQARVNLYAGNKQEALKQAKEVIESASKWFDWSAVTDIKNPKNPDRLFSSEVIFAIKNRDLEKTHDKLFSNVLTNDKLLVPIQEKLENIFGGPTLSSKDYRYTSSWEVPTEGRTRSGKTFFKFSKVEDNTKLFKFMQPLIRMSEMYYIVAETDTDKAEGLKYLNDVLAKRGLDPLPSNVNLEDEITKEYRKEFYGEGQLFFYYKRKNFAQIPNASKYPNIIQMDDTKYVVPLPQTEKDTK